MLTESVGWKFGRTQQEWLLSAPQCLGPRLRGSRGWITAAPGSGLAPWSIVPARAWLVVLAVDCEPCWDSGLEHPPHGLFMDLGLSRTAWQPQDFFLDGLRLQSGSHLAFYDLALKVTPCHKPAQIQRERDKFHLSVLLQKSMWDRRYCYCCVWIGLPRWC